MVLAFPGVTRELFDALAPETASWLDAMGSARVSFGQAVAGDGSDPTSALVTALQGSDPAVRRDPRSIFAPGAVANNLLEVYKRAGFVTAYVDDACDRLYVGVITRGGGASPVVLGE